MAKEGEKNECLRMVPKDFTALSLVFIQDDIAFMTYFSEA